MPSQIPSDLGILLPMLGSIVAFLVGVWKYLDAKKAEARNKRFDQFRLISSWLSGRTEDGKPLVDIQQAIAAYQLAEFPEYRDISLPIIEYYLGRTADEKDTDLFRRALLSVQAKLAKAN